MCGIEADRPVDSRFQRWFKKDNVLLGRCPRLEMISALGAYIRCVEMASAVGAERPNAGMNRGRWG